MDVTTANLEKVKSQALPDGKATQRGALIKLEFADSTTAQQLDRISKYMFGFDEDVPDVEARINQYWPTTDDILFREARQSYVDVTQPFTEAPKVYKLKSSREKVWLGTKQQLDHENLMREKRQKALAEAKAKAEREEAKKKAKIKGSKGKDKVPQIADTGADIGVGAVVGSQKARPPTPEREKRTKPKRDKDGNIIPEAVFNPDDRPETPNSPLVRRHGAEFNVKGVEVSSNANTYFDPFDVPKPWITKKTLTGKYYFIHEFTGERVDIQPAVLWETKYEKIRKLTPNDDRTGFEYVEDEEEVNTRLENLSVYEEKLLEEIKRRETKPTRVEQVEDCLFDMVEHVHNATETLAVEEKLAKLERKRRSWNTCTRGYRMVKLGTSMTAEGVVQKVVSDLDFSDMAISDFGGMFALNTPPGLFLKFAEEREVKRLQALEDKRLAEEARALRLVRIEQGDGTTLADNTQLIVAMAMNNPAAALRKTLSKIKERALRYPRILNFHIEPYYDRQVLYKESKNMVIQGLTGLLKAARNPKRAFRRMNKQMKTVYDEIVHPKSADDIALAEALKEYGHVEEEEEEEDDDASTVAPPVLSDHEINLANLRAANEHAMRKNASGLNPPKPEPIVRADTVCITLTMLVSPPPHFIKRPPRSQADDVYEDPRFANVADKAAAWNAKVKSAVQKYLLGNFVAATGALVDGALSVAIAIGEEFSDPAVPLPGAGGSSSSSSSSVPAVETNDQAGSDYADVKVGAMAVTGVEVVPAEGSVDASQSGGMDGSSATPAGSIGSSKQEGAQVIEITDPALVNVVDTTAVLINRKTQYDRLRENMFESKMPPQFAPEKYNRRYYYKPAYYDKQHQPPVLGVPEPAEGQGEEEEDDDPLDTSVLAKMRRLKKAKIVLPPILSSEHRNKLKTLGATVAVTAGVVAETAKGIIVGGDEPPLEEDEHEYRFGGGGDEVSELGSPGAGPGPGGEDGVGLGADPLGLDTPVDGGVADPLGLDAPPPGTDAQDDAVPVDEVDELDLDSQGNEVFPDAGGPVPVRDILDPSLRRQFEHQLLEELATAACIPSRHLSIEEIRILPKNDQRLLELVQRNRAIIHAMECGAQGAVNVDGESITEDERVQEVGAEADVEDIDVSGSRPVTAGVLEAGVAEEAEEEAQKVLPPPPVPLLEAESSGTSPRAPLAVNTQSHRDLSEEQVALAAQAAADYRYTNPHASTPVPVPVEAADYRYTNPHASTPVPVPHASTPVPVSGEAAGPDHHPHWLPSPVPVEDAMLPLPGADAEVVLRPATGLTEIGGDDLALVPSDQTLPTGRAPRTLLDLGTNVPLLDMAAIRDQFRIGRGEVSIVAKKQALLDERRRVLDERQRLVDERRAYLAVRELQLNGPPESRIRAVKNKLGTLMTPLLLAMGVGAAAEDDAVDAEPEPEGAEIRAVGSDGTAVAGAVDYSPVEAAGSPGIEAAAEPNETVARGEAGIEALVAAAATDVERPSSTGSVAAGADSGTGAGDSSGDGGLRPTSAVASGAPGGEPSSLSPHDEEVDLCPGAAQGSMVTVASVLPELPELEFEPLEPLYREERYTLEQFVSDLPYGDEAAEKAAELKADALERLAHLKAGDYTETYGAPQLPTPMEIVRAIQRLMGTASEHGQHVDGSSARPLPLEGGDGALLDYSEEYSRERSGTMDNSLGNARRGSIENSYNADHTPGSQGRKNSLGGANDPDNSGSGNRVQSGAMAMSSKPSSRPTSAERRASTKVSAGEAKMEKQMSLHAAAMLVDNGSSQDQESSQDDDSSFRSSSSVSSAISSHISGASPCSPLGPFVPASDVVPPDGQAAIHMIPEGKENDDEASIAPGAARPGADNSVDDSGGNVLAMGACSPVPGVASKRNSLTMDNVKALGSDPGLVMSVSMGTPSRSRAASIADAVTGSVPDEQVALVPVPNAAAEGVIEAASGDGDESSEASRRLSLVGLTEEDVTQSMRSIHISYPLDGSVVSKLGHGGLPNPSARLKDPSYWLGREMKDLTEQEKQQKRVIRLRKYAAAKDISEEQKFVRFHLDEWAYDAANYLEPLMENVLVPAAKALKARVILPSIHYSKTVVKPAIIEAKQMVARKAADRLSYYREEYNKIRRKNQPVQVVDHAYESRKSSTVAAEPEEEEEEASDDSEIDADDLERQQKKEARTRGKAQRKAKDIAVQDHSREEILMDNLGEDALARRVEQHLMMCEEFDEQVVGALGDVLDEIELGLFDVAFDPPVVSVLSDTDHAQFAGFIAAHRFKPAPSPAPAPAEVVVSSSAKSVASDSEKPDSDSGPNSGSGSEKSGGSDEHGDADPVEAELDSDGDPIEREDEDESEGGDNDEIELDSNGDPIEREGAEDETEGVQSGGVDPEKDSDAESEDAEASVTFDPAELQRLKEEHEEEVARWESQYQELYDQRVQEYDPDIVDLLTKMCLSIEVAQTEEAEELKALEQEEKKAAKEAKRAAKRRAKETKEKAANPAAAAEAAAEDAVGGLGQISKYLPPSMAVGKGLPSVASMRSFASVKTINPMDVVARGKAVIEEMKMKIDSRLLERQMDYEEAVLEDCIAVQVAHNRKVGAGGDNFKFDPEKGKMVRVPRPQATVAAVANTTVSESEPGEQGVGSQRLVTVDAGVDADASVPAPVDGGDGSGGAPERSEDDEEELEPAQAVLATSEHAAVSPNPNPNGASLDEEVDEYGFDDPLLDAADAEAYKILTETAGEPEPDDDLVGCEVSVMVYVDDKLKKHMEEHAGIDNLQAEDIAQLIRQQIFEPGSLLHEGQLTRKTLDVRFLQVSKKRQFPSWESFWVHILHPAFFNYQTKKKITANTVEQILQKKYTKDKRLPSGLLTYSPIEDFSDRNKETFTFLGNSEYMDKFKKKKGDGSDSEGEDDPELKVEEIALDEGEAEDDEDSDDEEGKKKAEKKAPSMLNLNVDKYADELGDDDQYKLKLYRPNMLELNAREVEKLNRIHQAFELQYNEEMRKGLVDGKRLHVTQFQAMKDRDTAYRIYRTAKMKFEQNNRKQSEGVTEDPVMQVTKITLDRFQGWVDEIKAEDHLQLVTNVAQAHRKRMQHMEEAMIRQRYGLQEMWIYKTLTSRCTEPRMIENALAEEKKHHDFLVNKLKTQSYDVDNITNVAEKQFAIQLQETSRLMIQEEKTTRVLFDLAVEWHKWKVETDKEAERLQSAFASRRGSTDSGMSGAGSVTGTPGIPVGGVLSPLGSVSVSDHNSSLAHGEEAASPHSLGAGKGKKKKKKKKKKEEEEEEELIPTIPKAALHSYLLALKLIVDSTKKVLHHRKQLQDRKNRQAAKLRRETKLREATEIAIGSSGPNTNANSPMMSRQGSIMVPNVGMSRQSSANRHGSFVSNAPNPVNRQGSSVALSPIGSPLGPTRKGSVARAAPAPAGIPGPPTDEISPLNSPMVSPVVGRKTRKTSFILPEDGVSVSGAEGDDSTIMSMAASLGTSLGAGKSLMSGSGTMNRSTLRQGSFRMSRQGSMSNLEGEDLPHPEELLGASMHGYLKQKRVNIESSCQLDPKTGLPPVAASETAAAPSKPQGRTSMSQVVVPEEAVDLSKLPCGNDANDLVLYQQLKWIHSAFEQKDLMYSFENLPTVKPDRYNRDEVAQFAHLLVDIEPKMNKARIIVARNKEEAEKRQFGLLKRNMRVSEGEGEEGEDNGEHKEGGDQGVPGRRSSTDAAVDRGVLAATAESAAAAVMVGTGAEEGTKTPSKNRSSLRQHRRPVAAAADNTPKTKEELLKDAIALEGERRAEKMKEFAKNRGKREAQRALAHAHLYVKVPGVKNPYCIVCKERKYAYWLENITKAEAHWQDMYPTHMLQYLDDRKELLKSRLKQVLADKKLSAAFLKDMKGRYHAQTLARASRKEQKLQRRLSRAASAADGSTSGSEMTRSAAAAAADAAAPSSLSGMGLGVGLGLKLNMTTTKEDAVLGGTSSVIIICMNDMLDVVAARSDDDAMRSSSLWSYSLELAYRYVHDKEVLEQKREEEAESRALAAADAEASTNDTTGVSTGGLSLGGLLGGGTKQSPMRAAQLQLGTPGSIHTPLPATRVSAADMTLARRARTAAAKLSAGELLDRTISVLQRVRFRFNMTKYPLPLVLRMKDKSGNYKEHPVPAHILHAGLSYVDVRGRDIVMGELKAGIKAEGALNRRAKKAAGEDDDGNKSDDEDEEAPTAPNTDPVPEILVKLWSKNSEGATGTEKGVFLGCAAYTSSELMDLDGPTGVRRRDLKAKHVPVCTPPTRVMNADGSFTIVKPVSSKGPVVSGFLSIKLTFPKIDRSTETPLQWKLEIVKGTRIAAADMEDKTFPFCEVYWRGELDQSSLAEQNHQYKNRHSKSKSKHKPKAATATATALPPGSLNAVMSTVLEETGSQLDAGTSTVDGGSVKDDGVVAGAIVPSSARSSASIKDRIGQDSQGPVVAVDPPLEQPLEPELPAFEWVLCGHTMNKAATLNPTWGKADDNVFLLPPIWTEHPIEGRCDDGSAQKGGGWVPRNHPLAISPPAEVAVVVEDPALFAAKSMKSKKEKKNKNEEDKLESQLMRRVSVLKSLATAQESERKMMLKEEIAMRKYVLEEELDRCAPYIETQKLYAKGFGSLLHNIQDAPKVLSRLRFMMGFETGGGGLHAMCQDPSNYMVLDVLAVPILYPEDENELVGALSPLIGKQNPNLIRIIDFSLHYARGFNATGFTSTDDRMGIIVMERPASRTVSEYISSKWDALTNDALRGILLQVAQALSSIHQEGGIHRNFYPGCVTIFLPEEVYLRKDNNAGGGGGDSSELVSVTNEEKSPVAAGGKKATFKNEPVCKVGDYWFLHNPRTPGCTYSLGRADWGNRSTLPPEASQGAVGSAFITDKSDIYAFGICVLVWVTNGRTTQLPALTKEMAALPSFTNIVDGLSSVLPRRWGIWVHSLLKMCLQPAPKNRATSRDIVRFLSSSVGKK